MARPETISEAYLREQQKLHQNPHYGVASTQFAPMVANILRETGIRELCDYGAGKQRLLETLTSLGASNGLTYHPYDPAFPDYGDPVPAPLVCCIDVLEHIEPDLLDNVLAELAGLVQQLGFFTVHTGPAGKVLSDGRNAHLIQQPTSWWLPRIARHFEVEALQKHSVYGGGFMLVVAPKQPG